MRPPAHPPQSHTISPRARPFQHAAVLTFREVRFSMIYVRIALLTDVLVRSRKGRN